MPLIGILIGGIDLSDLSFSVGGAEVTYGVFLQNVVDFVIIAFAVFVAIKLMSRLQRKQDEAPEEEKPAPPPEDIQLLREIRDALRK
jgi:large conductance mechanosensitive channel